MSCCVNYNPKSYYTTLCTGDKDKERTRECHRRGVSMVSLGNIYFHSRRVEDV